MVNKFFTCPQARQRMHEGPLGTYVDEYAALLHEQGYHPVYAAWQIRWVAVLSRWLQHRGLHAKDLTPATVARYLRFRKKRWPIRRGENSVPKRYLAFLHQKGVLPPKAPPRAKNARELAEESFERYLFEERGLSQATATNYLPFVRRFLAERFVRKPLRFDWLRATDITGHVQRHARDFCPKRAGLLVSALRSFLRYLRHRGLIVTDLAACVPTIATWRLSTLPKFLSPNQVRMVLRGCDRKTPIGRRDYAVLILLAHLGLRAGEIVVLTIDDLDWDVGAITVRGKGKQQARLPMPHNVGRALASYLKNGRPRCSSRRVFIRDRAPRRGFTHAGTVSTIVERALEHADVSSERKGAHLFRHSLATNMLQRGASLTEIGQILRHRGADTTSIYAKVDLTSLRPLALSWPGGAR